MLIVVSLLAILASVVLPYFEPSLHDQLQATAQIVTIDLAYARNLAVTNGSKYEVAFDARTNQYILRHSGSNPQLDNLPPSPYARPSDPPQQHIMRLHSLPYSGPGIELVAVHYANESPRDQRVIEFGPLGETTVAQPLQIWLASGVGERRRYQQIIVDPVTGMAEIGVFQALGPGALFSSS